MGRKGFLIGGSTVLGVACLLLAAGSSLADGLGQGRGLYQWSGGGGSTSYAQPFSAPALAPASVPAAGYQSFYYAPAANAGSFSAPAATGGYQSFYAPADNTASGMERSDRRVLISVRVPANAGISFDGEKTTQTGSFRQFISPPLQTGHNYTYAVQARWMDNGQPVVQDRTITVHPGDRINLAFMSPAK